MNSVQGPTSERADVRIVLVDRFDRDHILPAESGQTLAHFLIKHHIPSDAIIAYVNGHVIDDQQYILEPNSSVKLRMVRAYQLPEFDRMLGLWKSPQKSRPETSKSIYTKNVLWFNENGICELRHQSFTQDNLIKWVEETFIEGILSKDLIAEGDEIGIALSGGRDSVALLYLLDRCRSKLPNFTLDAFTVTPLAHDSDIEIAQEVAKATKVRRYQLITAADLESIFHLKLPYQQAVEKVFYRYGRSKAIYVAHHMLRTGVENYLRPAKISKICLGYHTEDLLAGILRGTILGWTFGESAAKKTWGTFTQIFPLWPITKKELTLYLERIGPPKHSSQGSPTLIDRGDHNRDMHYFIADSLQTLWPGFAMHFFDGLEKRYQRTQTVIHHKECPSCHGFFLPERNPESTNELCLVCSMFSELGVSEAS